MSHLMKYTEWESASGWHCGDVSDLAHGSNFWWHPARMLNIELTDYILMLKDKFHAVNFSYETVNLGHFSTYSRVPSYFAKHCREYAEYKEDR